MNRFETRLSRYRCAQSNRQNGLKRRGIAAFSAALGAAAAAGTADAAIQYSGPLNFTLSVTPDRSTSSASFGVDFNLDASTDINFFLTGENRKTTVGPMVTYTNYSRFTAQASLPAGGMVGSGYPAQLSTGAVISSAVPFLNAGVLLRENYYFGTYGFFNGTGFLGVSFDIAGDTHYGWLQLDVQDDGGGAASITLIDYAWETTPDTAIETGAVPEPSTLGLLALGAAGVLASRRRREAA